MSPAPRPSPFGPVDHAAAAVLLACAAAALALAAAAEAGKLAAGAGLLAAWWAWHGPRLAIETTRPAGGRRG